MPGFNVENVVNYTIGQTVAKSSTQFIYNYTWEVHKLFDTSAANTPIVYVKDVSLPSVTLGKEDVKGASLNYKFASEATYDDVRLTFYDTVGFLELLRKWRKSIWDQSTGLRTAYEYKKQSDIKVYTPDGELTEIYVLNGSWPSTIKYGDLTYTSSDVKFVDLTVSYDWAEEYLSEADMNENERRYN